MSVYVIAQVKMIDRAHNVRIVTAPSHSRTVAAAERTALARSRKAGRNNGDRETAYKRSGRDRDENAGRSRCANVPLAPFSFRLKQPLPRSLSRRRLRSS